MRYFILPLLAALGFALAAPADASSLAGRQARQQARIHQGVAQGDLTRGEAARLQRSQRRIHQSIRNDRVDGAGFTARERIKAHARLDQQSRRIARARNN
jgi:hypothetical protein